MILGSAPFARHENVPEAEGFRFVVGSAESRALRVPPIKRARAQSQPARDAIPARGQRNSNGRTGRGCLGHLGARNRAGASGVRRRMHRTPIMTAEDQKLDARWRARFGEPLPILGAAEFVRKILDAPAQPAPRAQRAGPAWSVR